MEDVSNKLMTRAWRAAMYRQSENQDQLVELEKAIATVRAELETSKGIILQLEVAMSKLGMAPPDPASFKRTEHNIREFLGALA